MIDPFLDQKTIDCQPPYDQIITEPGTTILSPNHPGLYNRGLDCQTTIRFSDNVRIVFQELDVPKSTMPTLGKRHRFWPLPTFGPLPPFGPLPTVRTEHCLYDYLKVHDGETPLDSNQIGHRLCGSGNPPSIVSSGKAITLTFHSDSLRSLRFSRSGFRIKALLDWQGR